MKIRIKNILKDNGDKKKWNKNITVILCQTKYSMKIIHWPVMESVGEIECKFNGILHWHGSNKQMFKNFLHCKFSPVNHSNYKEYSILLGCFSIFHFNDFFFFQCRLLTSQHPMAMIATVIIWCVGKGLPSLCFKLAAWYFHGTYYGFHPFLHRYLFSGVNCDTEISLYASPSLLFFLLKVICCFIFKDWKISTVHNIQDLSAVYKGTMMPFCFLVLS